MGVFEMLCLGSHGERLSARPPSRWAFRSGKTRYELKDRIRRGDHYLPPRLTDYPISKKSVTGEGSDSMQRGFIPMVRLEARAHSSPSI